VDRGSAGSSRVGSASCDLTRHRREGARGLDRRSAVGRQRDEQVDHRPDPTTAKARTCGSRMTRPPTTITRGRLSPEPTASGGHMFPLDADLRANREPPPLDDGRTRAGALAPEVARPVPSAPRVPRRALGEGSWHCG
jgi:hypothetical protein